MQKNMENNYLVIITDLAEEDLAEIEDYISNELNAPIAMKEFIDAFSLTLQRLSFSPFGPKVRNDFLAARGVRWISIKNYIAFYTINEQEKEIWVERILYGRRNWLNIL